MNYVCPECLGKDDQELWEEVCGWVRYGDAPHTGLTNLVNEAMQTGSMGCTCGWEGLEKELVRLDIYGRVLTERPKSQTAFDIYDISE